MNQEDRTKIILEDKINKVLFQLTLPMVFGVLGMVIFNLVDTYFIGKLGTLEMAALTYTFPVVLVFNSLNMGIGIGAAAVIAKAVGNKDNHKIKTLATDSLLLGIFLAVIFVSIGLLTVEPLFQLLGADQEVMVFILQYMRIWYAGFPFVVIPMVGNNAIRALGDTKTPSMIMLVAAIINMALDPLFIFGFGNFQGWGISGAASATVGARFITFLVSISILVYREKVIDIKGISWQRIKQSWGVVLSIGIPNAITRITLPLGVGVITGLMSKLGNDVVAGFGIGSRFEFFLVAIPNALASIFPVFIGQNFGAKQYDRIRTGLRNAQIFSYIYGACIYILLFFAAPLIARLFSDQDSVIKIIVQYLRIVPLGYGCFAFLRLLNGTYNALMMPIKASLINPIQTFAIYIPLSFVLVNDFSATGIFVSLAASFFITNIIFQIIWNRETFDRVETAKYFSPPAS